MWLTTKPFRYKLRDVRGSENGRETGVRLIFTPVPQPPVQRRSERKRDQGRDILKFIKNLETKSN